MSNSARRRRPHGVADRGLAALPVLALGFRPFYLAASAFAALAVPLWTAQYAGWVHLDGYLIGPAWHAHEMVFGFAGAVVTGFLFTAVRNWTGLQTPTGATLAGLLGLWALGRVAVLTGPPTLALLVDGAFLPAVAVALAFPILKSRNVRNLFVVGVAGGLAAANIAFHLDQMRVLGSGAGATAVALSFDALAILMAVIAGRVVPMFTRNAVPDARSRRSRIVEIGALGTLVLVLVLDMLEASLGDAPWLAIVAGVAAGLHLVRLWLWDPLATRHEPLLWILPLSYAWLPAALALRAAAGVTDVIPAAASQHALGIGAMAGLMLAMMTRSALGHTGRPLKAGAGEISAYVLIQLAALLRVVPALTASGAYGLGLTLSSLCWSAAFTIFFLRYWPILTRPRVDGRPG